MRIFKYNLSKKILGVLVILGCSGIFLNGYVGIGESVYAENTTIENTTDTTDEPEPASDVMGTFQLLDMILKLIYILLWPLLVVAGLAMDNTLVYASIFHLDAPLWKFWNMMKNFANFTLGFMVLFAIIKSIISGGGGGSIKDEKTPLGIIKQTLIAGILVQASWFMMAVLIDVSTIATYAIGGLPLSVLKDTDIGNQRILTVNSTIDLDKFDLLDKEKKGFKVYYSTTYKNNVIKISPCRIEKDFIVGRELGHEDYINTPYFVGDYAGYEVCALFGNQLVMRKEGEFMDKIAAASDIATTDPQSTYKNEAGYARHMDALFAIEGRDTRSDLTQGLVKYNSGIQQDGFVKGSGFFAASDSITLDELIDKSKGFVGPLVTMYSSLLNFTQLTDTNVTSISESSGIFLIKTGIAVALFFPLLALAAVLIARIALLWLFIIGSPFIIIKATFKDFPKLGKLDDYISIKSVMGIIFAPVVTVAALSLSLIFMTALISGFKSGENQGISSDVAQSLEIEPIPTNNGNQIFNVAGISEIEFQDFDRGGTLDWFSWLIVNFFAIGLLWTIFFAAIKSNSLGKAVGAPIEKFGKNFFETMPIIPFNEGKSKVGVGSFLSGIKQAPDNWVGQRMTSQQNEVLQRFSGATPGGTTPTTITTDQAKTIVTSIGSGNITTREQAEKIFTDNNITDAAENITANEQTYYKAIQGMNATEQAGAIAGVELIAGTDWREKMQKAEAKTAIDTTIASVITDTMTEVEVQTILDATANKTLLDNYFDIDTTANNYIITTTGGKTVTITKTTASGVNTYTGTAPTP